MYSIASMPLHSLLIAASSLGRAVADDFWMLLLSVMIFGIGGPIVSSGAPKVVAQLFTDSSRGLAMGIYMTGPAIGGVVTLTLSNSVLLPWLGDWRAIMWLWSWVTVGAAALWFLIATLARLDARESEVRATERVSQLELMGRLIAAPAVRVVLLMSVGVFLFNHGLNNWLPEVLQVGGMSAVTAGYWAALPTVVGILASLTIPRLATPDRRFAILLSLCLAAAFASVLLQAVKHEHARLKMPPAGPLEAYEVQALEKWIADGAVWPESPEEFFQARIAPVKEAYAGGDPVDIRLIFRSEDKTDLRIRIGVFGNEARSRLVLEQIRQAL